MAIPLKLGSIEQEHLQELYEASGIPRDDLPYSPALSLLAQGFQDRTFKNADEGQVFGAILKYVRSGRCAKASGAVPAGFPGQAEHARVLRAQLHAGRKIQPYTPEFDAARGEFRRKAGAELSPHEFWLVLKAACERVPAAKSNRRGAASTELACAVSIPAAQE